MASHAAEFAILDIYEDPEDSDILLCHLNCIFNDGNGTCTTGVVEASLDKNSMSTWKATIIAAIVAHGINMGFTDLTAANTLMHAFTSGS